MLYKINAKRYICFENKMKNHILQDRNFGHGQNTR